MPMKKPALVIMAAGMGSRFGGLKQITPVDEQGHVIIDFSLFDAWRAGFRDLIFVIKPELEASFRENIGSRAEKYLNITYVYQTIDKLPVGYRVPEGRQKPWGTAHAILCCKDVIDGPFAVINADDFYGFTAFSVIYDFLEKNADDSQYAMVGYRVCKTVSENGSVARAVCEIENGLLMGITERTKIFKHCADAVYTEDGKTFVDLPGDTIISMNFWGFMPKMLQKLETCFPVFLDETIASNPLRGELCLPTVVNDQLKDGTVSVRVLPCEENWYGVTYREDLDSVKEAIAAMKKQGLYNEHLWD